MVSAYYNEVDPFAAEWLRNLIAAGLIAPGYVDERDIRDVRPSDLDGYTQCHFFAGIGVWSYALRRAGWPDDRPVWTGSCPCQPFSAAGRRGGVADERHLWPHWHHLIGECNPPVVFGEQVASKDGLGWLDLVQADLEGAGYASGAIDTCAAGVGAPHIRQRLYFVAKRLEHTSRDGRDERRPEPGGRGLAGGCGADGLAHHHQPGLEGRREPGRECANQRPVGANGLAGGLGHPERIGAGRDARTSLETEGGPALRAKRDDARPPSSLRGMADAERLERERRRAGEAGNQPGAIQRTERFCDADRPGPTNGFWRDSDWLFCRDGKWRPVEPGTFPLADGAPSRVGRLRAYGNAIVAEQARAFVEAYLDVHTVEAHAVDIFA